MSGKLIKQLRVNLMIGLILLTPFVIAALVFNWLFRFLINNPLFGFLDARLRLLLPAAMLESGYEKIILKVLVLLLVLLFLFLVGFVVRSLVGRRLYKTGDRLLGRIPIFNRIYLFVRQISESLITSRETLFKEVVLVEYPRRGLYSIAFVTAATPASFRRSIPPGPEGEDPFLSLFVPTTPNPTSGYLIFAPRRECIPLPIELSDAMKLVLSGGVLYPGADLAANQPDLLEKLEAWFSRDLRAAVGADTEKENGDG